MNPTRLSISLALAICSAPLLAKEPVVAPDDLVSTLTYACADGKKLTAVTDATDPDNAKTTISVDGDPALQGIEMHDVMSANGVKTSNGKLTWWTKGDEGFLAEEDPPAGNGEVVLSDCKEIAPGP